MAAAIATALVVAGGLPARAQSSKPKATEIGVTDTTIRIAVVADVDTPLAPGVFKGAVDGMQAAVKVINKEGGVAGRKLQLDFIDSKLSPNDTRNAIITACQQDFAMVGTQALFMTNVDDLVACKDQKGQATGLPDLAGIAIGTTELCSPVTFPARPPFMDCDTINDSTQTYFASVGPVKYQLRKHGKLNGAFIYGNDTKDGALQSEVLYQAYTQTGVIADQHVGISARAPQSAYTPVVQKMKDDGSNYSFIVQPPSGVIQFRSEAALQGIDSSKVVWDCTSTCYDVKLSQAGSAVDGQYASVPFLPFDEVKYNKSLATYVNAIGKDNTSGTSVYSYVAGLAFQQAMKSIVQKDGINGVTRSALLAALKNLTGFNAGGMVGTIDIGSKVGGSPCFVETQIEGGKFSRIYPAKKGTFDCKKSNVATVKANLRGN